MNYIRLIKYPGSKNSILPDIATEFRKSGSFTFVDVFGGSGTVSLNAGSPDTVYNDASPEMYNLFLELRRRPYDVEGLLASFIALVEENAGGTSNRKLNAYIHRSGEMMLDELMDGRYAHRGFSPRNVEPGLESAVRVLYRFSTSFGGMGNTYSTDNEKSVYRNLVKTLENLRPVMARVEKWKIENMDFRDLMEKYDEKGVFFYFDPPYPGKDWYNLNFTMKDFEELAGIIEGMKGKYLLNIDSDRDDLADIFGDPSFVRSYDNNNRKDDSTSVALRKKSFYTNTGEK